MPSHRQRLPVGMRKVALGIPMIGALAGGALGAISGPKDGSETTGGLLGRIAGGAALGYGGGSMLARGGGAAVAKKGILGAPPIPQAAAPGKVLSQSHLPTIAPENIRSYAKGPAPRVAPPPKKKSIWSFRGKKPGVEQVAPGVAPGQIMPGGTFPTEPTMSTMAQRQAMSTPPPLPAAVQRQASMRGPYEGKVALSSVMDIDTIRKFASIEQGKQYFEDAPAIDPVAEFAFYKAADAQDQELLIIASRLPGDTLGNYEALGGKYGRRVE